MSNPEITERVYREESSQLNIDTFGELLGYFMQTTNNVIDPGITSRFADYHADQKLSVISIDANSTDKSYIFTLDNNPAHVSVVLTHGYYLGFKNRRSEDFLRSIIDSSILVRRSVEEVEKLMMQGRPFMSSGDFLERFAKANGLTCSEK